MASLASLAVQLFFCQQATAQLPPEPDFHREQLFDTYEAFQLRLNSLVSGEEVDSLWSQLKSAHQIPYVHGDRVAFLHRGPFSSVAVVGDFNNWNPGAEDWQAHRLGDTDLWALEKSFPADARIDYKLVTAGKNWVLDPANTLESWSGFGANSELRMPQYKFPREAIRDDKAPRGELSKNKQVSSAKLDYAVNYRVYTPAGYSDESSQGLPAVYVTDGHEYAADHLGGMLIVLDNLIAAGSLQPTIAVFIDPRDPQSGFNRRIFEYTQNAKFLAFVADELVPAVDKEYRTAAKPAARTILGTSLGGLNAAYFGAARPDVFGNVAAQSPASFGRFAPDVLNLYATKRLQKKLHLFVSTGTINDGNGGVNLARTLAAHNYRHTFVRTNEGHAWANWRAQLDDILITLVGKKNETAKDAKAIKD